ncbi:hypothetical protein SAMN04488691_10810 [Haloferax larsenii]|uniref:Uncharacterized protein n=2 Tax=Haloferax larsenii TaxID=302484 RepID=A0A1H7SZD3_HALLR|nr:hypothetical protein SAMN04488691_10810 [Haloferax larsenii]
MTDNTEFTPSRRSVLKQIAAASVGVAGMSGISAAESAVSTDERESLVQSKTVKQVRQEVGNPEIREGRKVVSTVSDSTIEVYRFTTDIGELRVIDVDGEQNAQFIFSDEIKKLDKKVKKKYKNVKKVDFATLISNSSGKLVYIRGVTKKEQKKVQRHTDVESEEALTVYSSYSDSYEILHETGDDSVEKISVPATSDTNSVSGKEFVTPESQQVDVQVACDEDACWDCATYLGGGSVTCGGVCKYIGKAGIPGILACLGCLAVTGGLSYSECERCYNTC